MTTQTKWSHTSRLRDHLTRSSNPSQDKRSPYEVKEQGSDSRNRVMPHQAVSVGYGSVNRLTETAPRNTLMTGNTEGSYECRAVSRSRICDGQAPTVDGVFRQGN